MQVLRFTPNPNLGRGIVVGETPTHVEVMYEADLRLDPEHNPTRFIRRDNLNLVTFEEVEMYDSGLVQVIRASLARGRH